MSTPPTPGKSPGKRPGGGKPAGRSQGGPRNSSESSRSPEGSSRQSGNKGSASGKRRPRLTRVEETSAGGLVLRLDSDVIEAALIGRLDRRKRMVWSMPKGHVEEGETTEQAAVREAHEETGIQSRVIVPLGVIDFWFVAEGRRIHKTVHHFILEATGGELSDEDIEVEEVAWVPLAELPTRLGYADERRLLARVPGLLADAGYTVDTSALGFNEPDEAGADSA